jgi:hypothetical protein
MVNLREDAAIDAAIDVAGTLICILSDMVGRGVSIRAASDAILLIETARNGIALHCIPDLYSPEHAELLRDVRSLVKEEA